MLFTDIMQSVNIAILPIIIIPVAGLCCLVFYNRITALTGSAHSVQKESREIELKAQQYDPIKKQQLIQTLTDEVGILQRKINLIRTAIVLCFSGIVAFILSAITIMGGIFLPSLAIVTFILWLLGALSFIGGLITGIFEIKNPALHSLRLESQLLDSWIKQDQIL